MSNVPVVALAHYNAQSALRGAMMNGVQQKHMICQVVQFKNLESEYQKMFSDPIDDERFVYVIRDSQRVVKAITTSVVSAIKKTQVKM